MQCLQKVSHFLGAFFMVKKKHTVLNSSCTVYFIYNVNCLYAAVC